MHTRVSTDELYGVVRTATRATDVDTTSVDTPVSSSSLCLQPASINNKVERTQASTTVVESKKPLTAKQKEFLEEKKKQDEIRLKHQKHLDYEHGVLGDVLPLRHWLNCNRTRENDCKKLKELMQYACVSKTQIRKTQETVRNKKMHNRGDRSENKETKKENKRKQQRINLHQDTVVQYNPLYSQRMRILHDFFVPANDAFSLPLLNGFSKTNVTAATTTSTPSSVGGRDLFLPHARLLLQLSTYTRCDLALQFQYEVLLMSCNYWYANKPNFTIDWGDEHCIFKHIQTRSFQLLCPLEQQEASSYTTLHLSKTSDAKSKVVDALWRHSVYIHEALAQLGRVIVSLVKHSTILQLSHTEQQTFAEFSDVHLRKLQMTIIREAQLSTKHKTLLYFYSLALLLRSNIANYQLSSQTAFELVFWMDSVCPAVVHALRRVCMRMACRAVSSLPLCGAIDSDILPSWPCVFNMVTEPYTLKNVFSKMKDCRRRAWQHILSKVTTARNRNRKIDGIFEEYCTRLHFEFVPMLLNQIATMSMLGNYDYESNTPCMRQDPAFRIVYVYEHLHSRVRMQDVQLLNATSSVFYYLCVQHYLLRVLQYSPSLRTLFASHMNWNTLRVLNENVMGVMQKLMHNVFYAFGTEKLHHLKGVSFMRALIELNVQTKRENLIGLQDRYEQEIGALVRSEMTALGQWMPVTEFVEKYLSTSTTADVSASTLQKEQSERIRVLYTRLLEEHKNKISIEGSTGQQEHQPDNLQLKKTRSRKRSNKKDAAHKLQALLKTETKEREQVFGYIDSVCVPLYRKQTNNLRTKAQQRHFCDNISANKHVREIISVAYSTRDACLGLTQELYNVIEYICTKSWRHDSLPLRYYVYLYHMFVPVCAWSFVERVLAGHEKGNQLTSAMNALRNPAEFLSDDASKDTVQEVQYACDLALRILVVFVSLWQYHRQLQEFPLDQRMLVNQMLALKERAREHDIGASSTTTETTQCAVQPSWTCVYYCNCCKKVSNFIHGWNTAMGTNANSSSWTSRDQHNSNVSQETFLYTAITQRQHRRNFGFVNACVDTTQLNGDLFQQMYCKGTEHYFNNECGKEPLQQVCVLGKILKIGNRMISICPQPACGRISCIPTLSYVNAYGFSCAHCRSVYTNITRQLSLDNSRENSSPKLVKLTLFMRTSKNSWSKCDFCTKPASTCWIKYNILCCKEHSYRKSRKMYDAIERNLESKVNIQCTNDGYCSCSDTVTTCSGEMNRATVRYIIERYSDSSSRFVYNQTKAFGAQRARAKRKFEHVQRAKSIKSRSTATNAFRTKRQKM